MVLGQATNSRLGLDCFVGLLPNNARQQPTGEVENQVLKLSRWKSKSEQLVANRFLVSVRRKG